MVGLRGHHVSMAGNPCWVTVQGMEVKVFLGRRAVKRLLLFEPGVGQNVVLHVLLADRTSTHLGTSFLPSVVDWV